MLHNVTFLDMVLRLVLSTLLGALIGVERETHGRPAGLRTHILVCVGSTLFTLSSYLISDGRFDPGRITAQIVTGIGFLGAGTIIHQGSVVRGLTTAASIWTVAAIGVAVGIGGTALNLAIVTSVIVFITLNLVPKLEFMLLIKQKLLAITMRKDPVVLPEVFAMLSAYSAHLLTMAREESADSNTMVVTVRLRTGAAFEQDKLSEELAAADGVIGYQWL